MMERKPQKAFNVRANIVQGRTILAQRNNVYEIDEVGLGIWQLCDRTHTIEEIARILSEEYDVEFTRLVADCQEYIEDLTERGLLQ